MSLTDITIMLGAMLIVAIMHNILDAIEHKFDEAQTKKFRDRKRNEQSAKKEG